MLETQSLNVHFFIQSTQENQYLHAIHLHVAQMPIALPERALQHVLAPPVIMEIHTSSVDLSVL